ncbi:MAG: DUF952 domain-containing protein [Chloroflexi bacterium]|nr:DUF952 domain-containing protein [Chloroflexota bacterium]
MIYHITTQNAWNAASNKGEYRIDSLDTEGFIHCSTQAQVVRTANRFYPGQRGLVLLAIDPAELDTDVLYEEGEPGEDFPHIYGPINFDAIIEVIPFEPGESGDFHLPDSIQNTRHPAP